MRGFQSPAAAPRFALVLLATTVVLGCGAAQRPVQPATAVAPATVKASDTTSTASNPAPAANARLDAIAFVSRSTGYGMFTSRARGRCQALTGRTTNGGARFGPLAVVTAWPCNGYPPAATLTADGHGDAFLYDPGLFVSHDGGRIWAPSHQPGVVLAIATAGRSAWMLRADCPRHGGTCPLRLLLSADGGRTWAPSPAQPPGATVHAIDGQPATEGAAGQTWLLRTGRSSAYVMSGPASDVAPLWFTADGGATWSTRQVRCGPIAAISATLTAAPDGTLLAVCAGQPGAGYQEKSAGRSTDGGRSWTVHTPCPAARLTCHGGTPLDSGYLGQIDAVHAGTAFLVGDRSSLLVTTDGGSRWRTVRPVIGDSGGGTAEVIFVSRRDGFVLGDDTRRGERPAIWRTTDGGSHWSAVVPRAG
jgi:photosystem II stability/assembly factor-like uncharacterized protein